MTFQISDIIMNNLKDESILYYISVEDVQFEAKRIINRELTKDEIQKTKKLIEWGFNTDYQTILDTAIFEIINN